MAETTPGEMKTHAFICILLLQTAPPRYALFRYFVFIYITLEFEEWKRFITEIQSSFMRIKAFYMVSESPKCQVLKLQDRVNKPTVEGGSTVR